ncbi:alpha/beta fold hydrolase [Nocardia brasiliensis]|uniref:alpha/beta fold hydrolase n=1 Tax=Nocardia brasiliensis TaxID=37326 RepID=UPI00378E34FE
MRCEFPISARDGAHLSAARVGSASAPASVVYLHSTGTDAGYWTPLVEHLHQRLDGGIAQLVYDQRNHDHSATPSHTPEWSLATLIDDLESVLDHASGAIVLTAHSAAAALIHEWARHKPEATRRLAGIVFHNPSLESSCTPDTSDALPHHVVRGRSGPFDEFARHLCTAPDAPALHARKPGRGLADNEPQDEFAEPKAAELPAYSATSLSDEATAALRVIPTWVLTGQLDPVVAAHRSRHFAEQIWADYDTIPGAGHWLSYTDPRPAAEPILAALEVAYRAAHEPGGGGW